MHAYRKIIFLFLNQNIYVVGLFKRTVSIRQFFFWAPMESNMKLSKITRLHWTILDVSPELIQQLLYGIEIRAY